MKQVTGKPTMAVGGVGLSKDLQSSFMSETVAVNNLEDVARRIASGEFDLISVGRSLLIDPHWIEKARAGQPFAPFSQAAYASLS